MKNEIEYKFVPYTDKDYEFVYDTKKNAYKKYVEANWGTWDDVAQRDMFKKFVDTYGKDIQMIVADGKNIGFWHGETLPGGAYEVGNICIIPEYQGKGIGTKILKEVLEEHKNQDVYLRYFKQNPVVNLYKRLGFVLVEELPYHFKMVKAKTKTLKK